MTEVEWLTSTDPQAMLDFATERRLVEVASPGAGPWPWWTARKSRLFACACARQAWDGGPCPNCHGSGTYTVQVANPGLSAANGYSALTTYSEWRGCRHCGGGADTKGTGRVGGFTDPRSRKAVEVAERYADGEATGRVLRDAHRYLHLEAAHSPTWALAYAACQLPETTHPPDISRARNAAVPPATQAALLRCLCGNPWRPVMLQTYEATPSRVESGVLGTHRVCPAAAGRWVDPPWLAWGGGTVPQMARQIYADRDWALLPQLADALEEAGCPAEVACPAGCCGGWWLRTDGRLGADVCRTCTGPTGEPTGRVTHPLLAHARSGGPHARGCHVLDLLLGYK